ncbi:undecaprenyldiphospho-muramoylpentapeptide beta-N-acetylglucosaminyltransferase [Macrococcus hajekii]|uniref:UDP-N-acetylglucosamine--N-acetylmuramyl-(pentapeptide) pyrophosphoryl-undecaprenol N-acetylglucosamine transferase n=1 Tax=Macrococcus hajekii TaxID=198482 RepID=A0A4R6BMI0_9STAP|nr:undecaprenyldiphospho-muramoylpentapeptide beta-N-acetylglucosaminyltransferase [Macrococcus hajekii]TDM03039.1 undecaprenyldiphospho-muramoylpentapeptide beta-N-acetylglucosaminyltransferase [Macrococcus hajekii]GGB06081.1 UDP-N-acetylglucosamine--N-acetylmuramyl-(pentapeptide) pyrophosphoryl-undecaprenol N-acetylglucosamine transferase [Macrococcus hajekii]
MKIAFTGGGTVGHVAVNMALIPEAQTREIDCVYIGSKKGIEREMIESQFPDVRYHAISSGKLRRYLSVENAKDILKVQKGVLDALAILKKEKPDLIFSKGGFVTVPVVIAAKILNIKTIIHESDVTPGLANKIALKFATKLYTTFKETLNYVPASKADYIGSIIRADLLTGQQSEGYELTGFSAGKKVMMVMGGSLGSKVINEAIRKNLPTLLEDYQIIHITGKGLKDESINQAGYKQFEFVKAELPHLYAVTDVIVSRAGANAIFEFLALKKPMLLIPLGLDQSRGDQIENAKLFNKAGYAEVLEEAHIDQLPEVLNRLEARSSEVITAMSRMDISYTAATLLDKILKDIR